MASKDTAAFDKILYGRPPIYNKTADPDARTALKLLYEHPSVVTFTPGRIDFSEADKFLQSDMAKEVLGADIAERLKTGNDSSARLEYMKAYSNAGLSDATIKKLQQSITEARDSTFELTKLKAQSDSIKTIRYFDFKPAIREYSQVARTMYSRLAASVAADNSSGWQSTDIPNPQFEPDAYARLNFWCDATSSNASESFDTETGSTVLNDIVGGVQGFAKNLNYFQKQDDIARAANEGEIGFTDISAKLSGILSGSEAGGIRASLGDAVLGLNPLFPEVWKNSTMNRSYNLSFKFYSPYASKAAIAHHVLFPTVLLLSMILPQQKTPTSFGEPFIFQLDAPGRFVCDMGICTNLTITKGGNDRLYTPDGLPRMIEINMTVKDLYPTLMASQTMAPLYTNTGLSMWLDNMANLSVAQSGQRYSLVNALRARVNSVSFGVENFYDVHGSRITSKILSNPKAGAIASTLFNN